LIRIGRAGGNTSDRESPNQIGRVGISAKIARLNDAFSECFKLEASPVEGQSLQQKRSITAAKILISAHTQAKMS